MRLTAPATTIRLAAVLLTLAFLFPARDLGAQSAPGLSLPMPGIETFRPVTTTIACGTNPRPEAMAALRQAGFASVISFSEDTEAGYDRPALERAATDAGLRYVSIPFNTERPDPSAARRFLDVIAAPETSPAFLGCRSGQRAAAMWLIKRVAQEGWPVERAMAEAESLGLKRPELKAFATEFLTSRED